jgi:hypothetical protein
MGEACEEETEEYEDSIGCKVGTASIRIRNPGCCSYCRSGESSRDVAYQQGQEVPYNLTDSEKLKYSNERKTHSHRIATLEKHRGNVYALIYGQCTQILQDKMKQDKNWVTVSVSYKLLELYKLIKQVILKQTEDQYPVAALREQLSDVANAKLLI